MKINSTPSASKLLVGGILSLLLAGCWIPEKFNLAIKLKNDKTFSFIFGGTVANPILIEAIKNGMRKQEENDQVKSLVREFKQTGYKRADYLGKGRFDVLFESTEPLRKAFYFPNELEHLVSIVPDKKNVVEISF